VIAINNREFMDYYEVLELHRKASQQVIDRAYRTLAAIHHPDKNPNNTKYAEEKMKQINNAYEILGNPEKREQYNYLYDKMKSSYSTNNEEKYSYSQNNSKSSEKKNNKTNYRYREQPNHEEPISIKAIIESIKSNAWIFAIIILIIMIGFSIQKSNSGLGQIATPSNVEEDTLNKNLSILYGEFNLHLETDSQASSNNFVSYMDEFNNTSLLVGYINNNALNVRMGPGTTFKTIYNLEPNEAFIILGELDNWYNAYFFSDDYEGYGWIHSKYVNVFLFNLENNRLLDYTTPLEKSAEELSTSTAKNNVINNTSKTTGSKTSDEKEKTIPEEPYAISVSLNSATIHVGEEIEIKATHNAPGCSIFLERDSTYWPCNYSQNSISDDTSITYILYGKSPGVETMHFVLYTSKGHVLSESVQLLILE